MSFITVDIPPGSLQETQNWLAAKPVQVERAERRAVTKTLRWAGAFVARTVAIATAIPTTLLTKGGGTRDGVRVRYDFPRGRENGGSVWFGGNPIKSAYVGKLSQRDDERGARAGQFFFNGGFIATMSSGHTGVFKRRSQIRFFGDAGFELSKVARGRDSKGRLRRNRLPIAEQAVSLQAIKPATKAAQSFIPVRLDRTLAQEINFEVRVRGR